MIFIESSCYSILETFALIIAWNFVLFCKQRLLVLRVCEGYYFISFAVVYLHNFDISFASIYYVLKSFWLKRYIFQYFRFNAFFFCFYFIRVWNLIFSYITMRNNIIIQNNSYLFKDIMLASKIKCIFLL